MIISSREVIDGSPFQDGAGRFEKRWRGLRGEVYYLERGANTSLSAPLF